MVKFRYNTRADVTVHGIFDILLMMGGNRMGYYNAANAYKETRVRTAGQGQLIIMLYDEALKQLKIAAEALAEQKSAVPANIEKANKSILKTQEIITELMASLDFEAGGEIASNLFSLYSFFNRELMDANIQKNATKVANVQSLMSQLRLTWVEVVRTTASQNQPAVQGVNISG